MRILVWLFRAAAFFVLFAFALNNQHDTTLHFFFGQEWRGPTVFVVLGALALGCVLGALAMLPGWWRHKRQASPVDEAPNSVLPSRLDAPASDGFPVHPPRDGL